MNLQTARNKIIYIPIIIIGCLFKRQIQKSPKIQQFDFNLPLSIIIFSNLYNLPHSFNMFVVVKNLIQKSFLFSVKKQPRKPVQPKTSEQPIPQKDVFKAYRSQVEKSSILRQFRESVYRKSNLSEDWSNIKGQEIKTNQMLNDLVNNDGQKEYIVKKATDIQSRLVRSRGIFHQNSLHSLLSDYGDYTSYNKVHPKIQDRNLNQNQFFEDSSLVKNLYSFIDKLPEDYQQKIQIKNTINTFPVNAQNMTLTEFGQILQDKINQSQRQNSRDVQYYKTHLEGKSLLETPMARQASQINKGDNIHKYTGTPKRIDPWNQESGFSASLSPRAVDTIYELYLQGWTVRDISKRFGILPARTKFCVWVRAQLYHQIIPKLGVKFYLRALRYQQRHNQDQIFCDYGLDIPQLSNQSIIEGITQWNSNMLDAQRKQEEYRGAMMKLSQQKKFTKYQLVQVGRHGKQNARYSLKEWHIFRGKGSDQYFLKHKVFRKLSKAEKKFNKQYY